MHFLRAARGASDEREGVMTDRAEVVATTICQMVARAMRARLASDRSALTELRANIVSMLRDEFAEIARMVRDDIRLRD